jgi:enoyl-CoA hydratase/carnithine racemase
MPDDAGEAPAVQVGSSLLDGRVGLVELRRAPNNFFDVALLEQLVAAIDALVAQDARALVLAAAGKNFCAGAKLGGGRRQGDVYAAALPLFEVPVPIVVAAQGAVVGGGIGLALAGDLRIGSSETTFRPNFAQLGFNHGFGMSVTLPAVVGEQAALRLLLRAQTVRAEQAHALGLLDLIAPAENLRDVAIGEARLLAGHAPLAVASIRQLLRGERLARIRAAINAERSEQVRLMRTADFAEGVAAVNDRRTAWFTGT